MRVLREKHLLKVAMAPRLPEEILHRRLCPLARAQGIFVGGQLDRIADTQFPFEFRHGFSRNIGIQARDAGLIWAQGEWARRFCVVCGPGDPKPGLMT